MEKEGNKMVIDGNKKESSTIKITFWLNFRQDRYIFFFHTGERVSQYALH